MDAEAELFAHQEAGCEVYVHLRDSQFCADVRAHLARLWTHFKGSGLADPDFLRRFPTECPARIWEMRLASMLTAWGLSVVPSAVPGEGMDMGVTLTDGRKIWFEATAPTPGAATSSDRVNVPYGQIVHGVEVDRTTALRFLGSIAAKREQFQRAKASGLVGEADGLVVAISGAQIPLADLETPGEVPLIAKVLFGVGDTPFLVEVGTGRASNAPTRRGAPLARPSFRKATGADVQSRLFLSPDAEDVSAVLFDPHNVKNCPELRGGALGDDVIVVHNPFARSPINLGQLRGGREFAIQLGTVDHRSRPRSPRGSSSKGKARRRATRPSVRQG